MQLNGARIRRAGIAPLFIVAGHKARRGGVGAAPASLILVAIGVAPLLTPSFAAPDSSS